MLLVYSPDKRHYAYDGPKISCTETYARCYIGKNEIRPKFDAFIKHRNEIMHGGKNSYFDKNLSSAALFFLGIVYSSLGDKAT